MGYDDVDNGMMRIMKGILLMIILPLMMVKTVMVINLETSMTIMSLMRTKKRSDGMCIQWIKG